MWYKKAGLRISLPLYGVSAKKRDDASPMAQKPEHIKRTPATNALFMSLESLKIAVNILKFLVHISHVNAIYIIGDRGRLIGYRFHNGHSPVWHWLRIRHIEKQIR